jgi:hypothetical protein
MQRAWVGIALYGFLAVAPVARGALLQLAVGRMFACLLGSDEKGQRSVRCWNPQGGPSDLPPAFKTLTTLDRITLSADVLGGVGGDAAEFLGLWRYGEFEIPLGLNQSIARVLPQPRQVVAGEGLDEFCLVDASGRTSCRAAPPGGQPNSTAAEAVPYLARLREVALGTHLACGISTAGKLACWGNPVPGCEGLLSPPGDLSAPAGIALPEPADESDPARCRACVIDGDTLRCWGGPPALRVPLPAEPFGASRELILAHDPYWIGSETLTGAGPSGPRPAVLGGLESFSHPRLLGRRANNVCAVGDDKIRCLFRGPDDRISSQFELAHGFPALPLDPTAIARFLDRLAAESYAEKKAVFTVAAGIARDSADARMGVFVFFALERLIEGTASVVFTEQEIPYYRLQKQLLGSKYGVGSLRDFPPEAPYPRAALRLIAAALPALGSDALRDALLPPLGTALAAATPASLQTFLDAVQAQQSAIAAAQAAPRTAGPAELLTTLADYLRSPR